MSAIPSISPTMAGRKEWLALVVLILAVTLLAIDGTVLYMAVPALTADLSPSATQILWIGDIYSFVLAGLLVTMGNLADRIGRKRLLMIGSIAFGVASLLAAFAPSAEVLIAARALLGIAGATIMPSTLSIIRNLFHDPVQRTRAIAIWSAGAMAGGAVGPLVGGALLEFFWWGSVFLINVPVIVLIVVLGIWLLPESKNPNAGRIDLVSAVLSVLAIVPVVYAVKQVVGHGLDWSVLPTLLLGLGAGWLFVRRQQKLETPLVDISLFRIPAFGGAVAANALSIFAFFGLLFFFSQYLQLVRGYSPFWAGMAEMPATVASLAVVGVVGFALSKLGLGRAIAAGLLIGALGLALLGLTEGLPSYAGIGIALAVIGLGTGLAMTLSTDAVVAAAPPARAGAASSIAETAYELGVALGIGVLGSVQTALYRAQLEIPSGTSPEAAAALQDSLASAAGELGKTDDALLAVAQQAFTHGMQVTSFIAAALLVVAAVIAWRLIPSTTPLDKRTGEPRETH
ncbi:MFS transporter [Arthrobacter sp. zg-Y895]|uniref:MFS transporter n=1 Tax=Arthrobacter sp. zg-Y895 TaxID=2886933 RepID=UPI001D13CDE7|nr:MFS transporter [Arthrobacter sp. zg-Y895]MCC3301740.1 MFS transporter [Arthrobacter sp. zg-Y895]